MSEENVEVVRCAYERLNEGDLDGFLQSCAKDWEFRDLPDLPGSGVFIGHDAMRRWYAKLVDAFENLRFDVEKFIDTPGDCVVLMSRAKGRGRGSGATVDLTFSSVATLAHGKLVKLIVDSDHKDALEAAGLRRQRRYRRTPSRRPPERPVGSKAIPSGTLRLVAYPGDTAPAMSEENVELVRAGFAAYNRGDLDAVLETHDVDVEYVTLLLGNHRGKEALRRLFEENRETLTGYSLDPEELIDAGDQVVAVVRLGGAGRVSEITLDDRIAFLFTIQDGLLIRQQTFRNKDDAIEASGSGE